MRAPGGAAARLDLGDLENSVLLSSLLFPLFYLSAVQHLHISAAILDLFTTAMPMSRLEYVMRGIKKDQAAKGQEQRERLPITPAILHKIRVPWEPDGRQPDMKMLWAACCVFLRG